LGKYRKCSASASARDGPSGYCRTLRDPLRLLAVFVKWVMGAFYLLMTLLAVAQVVTRYILNVPMPWAEETIRYLFIWVTYLGAALATRYREQISVDLADWVIEKMSARIRPVARVAVEYISTFIEFLFAMILVFLTWRHVKSLIILGQVTPSLGMPMYLVYGGVLAGVLSMAVFGFYNLCRLGKGGDRA